VVYNWEAMASDHDERIARVLARYPGEEHAELRALIADLVADFDARLGQRDSLIATLTGRLGMLESAVEGLQRAGKRQAAPFAKRAPKANPKKSGRKPGEGYGPKAHRAVPQRLPDRELRADLPGLCPDCGGEIDAEGEASQWIEDIAITTVITKVVVAKGRCRCCRRRVQGRHPDQVSDALGAASSQLGPVAQGLIAILAKECGLSHGKVARVLRQLGITVTTGGVSQVLARLAAKADPTYEALKKAVNESPSVAADETGWRIGGWPGWLWTFAIEAATVYLVDHERSFEAATKVLEPDYEGVIERDGWAPYRSFKKATAQSCLAHLLRRCSGLIDARVRGYSTVPSILKEILTDALVLRGRRDAGEITPEELGVAVAGLDTRVKTLLARRGHTVENRKLLKHLGKEAPGLFTFLRCEGVQATNWRAEQAIRPGVVNRKVWGGSRTDKGGRTHERLVTILRTSAQQGCDAMAVLGELIRSAHPILAPLPILVPRAP
jgi:transposase